MNLAGIELSSLAYSTLRVIAFLIIIGCLVGFAILNGRLIKNVTEDGRRSIFSLSAIFAKYKSSEFYYLLLLFSLGMGAFFILLFLEALGR
jgi:H+/Cl- antiporter ClcA